MKVQWQEPVEFFQAYMRSTGTIPSRRSQILAGFIAAAVVVLLTLGYEWFFFLLHKKDLGVPLYFYFVAPVVAGLFVGFLTTMLLSIPATIVLTEKGLFRNKAYGSELHVQCWPWDIISEMAIEDVRYEGKAFRVLVVRTRLDEKDMLFGLGNAPLDEIRQFAAKMGKTIVDRVR